MRLSDDAIRKTTIAAVPEQKDSIGIICSMGRDPLIRPISQSRIMGAYVTQHLTNACADPPLSPSARVGASIASIVSHSRAYVNSRIYLLPFLYQNFR